MRLGVHVIQFTVTDGTAGIAPELARVGQAVEAAGVSHLSVMDHYFQMDRMFPATDPMLEGYTTLGFLAAHTSTGAARPAGHRRDLPPPRPARQDRVHCGRPVRRPRRARHRRRLVRPRAPRPRRAVPAGRRAVRAARGDPADLPADVGPGQQRRRSRASTTASRRRCAARCRSASRRSSSAVAGRRRPCGWSPQYADACNLFASSPRRCRPQAGRPARPLRRRGPRLRRRSRRRSLATARSPTPTRSSTDMSPYAKLGFDTAIVVPPGDAPAKWIDDLGAPIAAKLADL